MEKDQMPELALAPGFWSYRFDGVSDHYVFSPTGDDIIERLKRGETVVYEYPTPIMKD